MSDYSDLDPSIAEMLSNVKDTADESEDIDLSEFESAGEKKFSMEDFARRSKLFDSKADSVKKKTKSIHEVDLSQHEFEPVEQMLSDEASSVFEDKSYYKTALTNENASSQRVHQLLSKYLTCQDPKDRTVYRQNLISAYWELLRGMAPKMADINLPMPKRMMCRFGVLLPSLFRPEQKTFFSRIFFENRPCEPVMYVDEWFKEMGPNSSSTTLSRLKPEVAIEQTRLMQLKSKNSGKLQSAENLLNIKENERAMLETELKAKVDQLCEHNPVLGFEPHLCEYDEMQLKLFSEISDRLHRLSKNNKELSRCLREFQDAKGVYTSVENKLAGGPDISAATDSNAVNIEFQTVRQMAKMTVGRQGNQFPIFTREFFHCTERGTGTRENVIEILRWVESVDPGAFCRIHKNVPNRIVPYVLLIPTYGDRGFCWEPFDRYNRVTSRGRIVIPMYPRDLKIAVLTAVADLRWQVAKEKASYYWMEEGLTGQYYQHIDRLKLKGDLKAFFIEDYVLWMTKESEGVQRLDKEVRGIFWRNMPFPNERKQELRKRSLVYDELCIKDNNRAMSDGY